MTKPKDWPERPEMDFTQEWEYDFRNPPEVPPPHVQCDHCETPVLRADAFIVERKMKTTLYFCNENCANEWGLECLRRLD
jgi:hypothetical protein